jgi:hypothetical protein
MSVRFPEPTSRDLAEFADRTAWNKTTVVATAVDEWLRMQRHPGIRFQTEADGRRYARLWGGPKVWVIAEQWQGWDPAERSVEAFAESAGLPAADVEAALNYWAEFRDEIDAIVAANQRAAARDYAVWEQRRSLDAA